MLETPHASTHQWLSICRGHSGERSTIRTSNGEKWFVIGNMGVYVDDLLLVAPNNILEETLGALEERFTLATPEWVTGEKTVTFCGYEISKTDQGYALGQEKYIRDLIDKHNIKQTAGIPCPKIEDGPEEPSENLTGPVLQAAQQLCGELMRLTTRTRPDVAYTVGVMSRMLVSGLLCSFVANSSA